MNKSVPVYVFGRERPAAQRLLGMPLWRLLEVVARRAGLRVLEELPARGDVLLVDCDVALNSDALAEFHKSALELRRSDVGVVVAEQGGIAVVDASALSPESPPSRVAELGAMTARTVATLSVDVVHVDSRQTRRRARTILLRNGCKKLRRGDYFGVLNREVTLPLTRFTAPTRLSPNAISVIGFLIVLVSAVPLARGSYSGFLLGAFIQWIGSLLDGVDGKIARLKGQQSPLGCWLETVLDYAYYLVVTAAVASGFAATSPHLSLLTGASAMLGALITIVLLLGMRKRLVPADHPERFGAYTRKILESNNSPLFRFARFTYPLCTRAALPHLILVAALVSALPALFLFAGVGVHVVWVVAMAIDRLAAKERVETVADASLNVTTVASCTTATPVTGTAADPDNSASAAQIASQAAA